MYLGLFVVGGLADNNPRLYGAFFGLSVLFFMRTAIKLRLQQLSMDTVLITLMAYALPFSWRSFIGSPYNQLPISWFYVLGLCYVLAVLAMKQRLFTKAQLVLMGSALTTVIVTFVPLMYSNPSFLSQALTQFLVLLFNNVLVLVSLFRWRCLDKRQLETIINAYISGTFWTSVMLISQFILFKNFRQPFGFVDFLQNRELFYFLFTDISHGTLYLATGAFTLLYLTRFKTNNLKAYVQILIITVGSAVTSARTGIVMLGGFAVLFILFGQKGLLKKIISMMAIGSVGFYTFQMIQNVRNLGSVADLTNGSGRLSGYTSAVDLLEQSWLWGYGYSQNYLFELLKQAIPHLSILQYALHGGVFFALVLFVNQLLIWQDALHKQSMFPWLIMLVLGGTCLVPDLFATRFITLIEIVSISSQGHIDSSFSNLKWVDDRTLEN